MGKDTPGASSEANRIQQTLAQLCGIYDSMPEPLKSEFKGFKAKIDGALAELPETDKAMVAGEAAWTLRSLASLIMSFQEGMQNIAKFASDLESKVNEKVTASLCSRVEVSLNERIDKGELVTKAAHEAALGEARKNERMVVLNGIKIAEARRKELATAGIVLPDEEAAVEELLGGTDDEFNGRKTSLCARLATLTEKGLTEEATIKLLLHSKNFDREIKLMEQAVSLSARGNIFRPKIDADSNDDKANKGEKAVVGSSHFA